MKAMIYEQYGSPDVLELREVQKPEAKTGELLIKVRASAITPMDHHFLTGTPFLARILAGGLRKPKHIIPGVEIAGIVEAAGPGVTKFRPGDEVLGFSDNGGGYAEYAVFGESGLWPKPADLSFEQAATVHFSAMSALKCLCDYGKITKGQKVLINGASGGVGILGVQIAKDYGAEVTGVCSTRNVEVVRSQGVDHVVDYTQEDFVEQGLLYDVIFDSAAKRTFSEVKKALTPNGMYINTEFTPALLLHQLWRSLVGGQKMITMIPNPSGPGAYTEGLFAEFLAAGKLKPIIGVTFPLDQLPEAFRAFEKGGTPGRIVISQ